MRKTENDRLKVNEKDRNRDRGIEYRQKIKLKSERKRERDLRGKIKILLPRSGTQISTVITNKFSTRNEVRKREG